MAYKCNNFDIKELVGPDVFADRGEKAWQLLDDRALMTLDTLREDFGPCTVNNWAWGGNFESSGLRTVNSEHYSPYSQHTFGRAFDCKFSNYTAEEVRMAIKANPDRYPYINSMEEGVSWLHFDVRNSNFFTFHP